MSAGQHVRPRAPGLGRFLVVREAEAADMRQELQQHPQESAVDQDAEQTQALVSLYGTVCTLSCAVLDSCCSI